MSMYIDLHQEIYSLDDVHNAQEAYKKIATIAVVPYTNYWRCEFTACVADVQMTMQEFENYCIGMIASKRGESGQ